MAKEFAISLRAADLAEATRRGYAARSRQVPELDRAEPQSPGPLAPDLHRRPGQLPASPYPREETAGCDRQPQGAGSQKVFRLGRAEKLIPANPASALRLLRRQKRLQPAGLQDEEVQALLRAAGQTGHGLARRNYALLQLMLQTGLRVGEVAQLAISDCQINDRSGSVRVRAGKRGKEREVPLNALGAKSFGRISEDQRRLP